MQPFDPQQLVATLARILPAQASANLCVAFSGGLDSCVLLHALVGAGTRYQLRAVYVDHQLHAQSVDWHWHCERVCRALGVPYQQVAVRVRTELGESVEAAARTVRYAALRELLRPEEVLLTAHHADDQLETVLLALLRGSGVKGLAAMPAVRRFGGGWHARPLLEQTRAVLEHWARAQGLSWVSDPSNQAIDFDRNYLRAQVIPALQARWPSAAHSASRSAQHAAEAEQLLEELAEADAARAMVQMCLDVPAVAALNGPRRRNLLRHWLRRCGANMPSTRKLAGLEHDMLTAGHDRMPCTTWDQFAVRRHRDLLYCTPRAMTEPCRPQSWDWSTPLPLGALGSLHTAAVQGAGLAQARLGSRIQVCFRPHSADALSAVRGQQGKLKKLLHQAQVLPWCRDQVPLLVIDGWLAALGDWWVSEKFAARGAEAGVRILWQDAPTIRAQSRV